MGVPAGQGPVMTPHQEARRAMIYTLAFDVMAAALAMAAAVSFRLFGTGAEINAVTLKLIAMPTILFALSAGVAFRLMRVHRQVWRHAGWPDAMKIVQASLIAPLIFLALLFLITRTVGFPRTALPIALVLWLLLLFAGRMVALSRSTHQPFQIFSAVRKDAPAVILVGDEERSAEVIRDIGKMSGGAPVRVLGMIETGGAEPGRAIRGVPVMGGMVELGKVLDVLTVRYGTTPWVAAVGAARSRDNMNQLLETASKRGAKIMALGADAEGNPLQDIVPADLLARPERQLDSAPLSQLITGAKVFVTGAGGTIGGELAHQAAAFGPAHLTLYDASEYNLYDSDLRMRETYPDLPMTAKIGDVRDAPALAKSMTQAAPDLVIHAAALKHVPLMEANPNEAILTNVRGAINAARAALSSGTKRFVFISTDKAVDPDNVMGATKRLAEISIARILEGSGVAAAMVRFGNVLGSSGSVVPLFERQIARGGPVTVTDPNVTRYFMTVEEAATLVLQAGALQETAGEAALFLLDMGDPIRIEELAEAMIRMKGQVPGKDIEIKHTGMRPGESLHESLTYAHERIEETRIDGVQRVTGANGIHAAFDAKIDALLAAAEARDTKLALQVLSELVPEYGGD